MPLLCLLFFLCYKNLCSLFCGNDLYTFAKKDNTQGIKVRSLTDVSVATLIIIQRDSYATINTSFTELMKWGHHEVDVKLRYNFFIAVNIVT